MSRPRKQAKALAIPNAVALIPSEDQSVEGVLPTLPALMPDLNAEEVDQLCRQAGLLAISGQGLRSQKEVTDRIRRSGMLTILSGSILSRMDSAIRLRMDLLDLVRRRKESTGDPKSDASNDRTAVMAGDVIARVMMAEQSSTDQLIRVDGLLNSASGNKPTSKLPPANQPVEVNVMVRAKQG